MSSNPHQNLHSITLTLVIPDEELISVPLHGVKSQKTRKLTEKDRLLLDDKSKSIAKKRKFTMGDLL